jgi:hypothetical protein
MECYNCSALCYILDSTKNQGIRLEDGRIICLPCNEVLDFMNDKQAPARVIPVMQQVVPVKNVMMITCLKCKNKFSGRNCVCGFKNPLFR